VHALCQLHHRQRERQLAPRAARARTREGAPLLARASTAASTLARCSTPPP
jgi:hypothetical protein